MFEVQGERDKGLRRKKKEERLMGRGRREVGGQLHKRLFGPGSPGQGLEARK